METAEKFVDILHCYPLQVLLKFSAAQRGQRSGQVNYRACRRPVSCSRTLRHVCVSLKGTLLLQSNSITLVVTSVFVCMCIFMCVHLVFLLLLLSRDLLRS